MIEITGSNHSIGVSLFETRLIPSPHQIKFGWPTSGRRSQLLHQGDERAPHSGSLGRGTERGERVDGVSTHHLIEDFAGTGRADAVQQLQHAKARHTVGGVFGPAQDRQHILDVRGLDKLEAAEFDEGDVAAGELDLEHGAVVRGAKEHRLLP